ncbi:unnamed protein product [Bursaphelenchus okinawaensis]|uniref:Uncharacterized protein n=1 Tax=Bursaphelenchus okinawaensis TaxID=465554 RepID=A0A811KT00_9BILA|nr:unnamed protein product [Bursaphelenchus okinawaensis]CAG9110322.1 unnamed protein product [Bursaphelenchus okinawaensis]
MIIAYWILKASVDLLRRSVRKNLGPIEDSEGSEKITLISSRILMPNNDGCSKKMATRWLLKPQVRLDWILEHQKTIEEPGMITHYHRHSSLEVEMITVNVLFHLIKVEITRFLVIESVVLMANSLSSLELDINQSYYP